MRYKGLLAFIIIALAIVIPIYPMPNPTGNGTGEIQINVIGANNVQLTNFTYQLLNTVRLGCGTYAIYTFNTTYTFSNVASIPITVTIQVNSTWNTNGNQLSITNYILEILANSTNFVVTKKMPVQVSIENEPVLPILFCVAVLSQASNGIVTIPVPKTIPFYEWVSHPY